MLDSIYTHILVNIHFFNSLILLEDFYSGIICMGDPYFDTAFLIKFDFWVLFTTLVR